MAAKSWTDDKTNWCTCEIDECEKLHPATEPLPDRFAFWVKADRRGTYYAASDFDSFHIEVSDMQGNDPYAKGEAVVKDLATGAQMDAADFMKKYGR